MTFYLKKRDHLIISKNLRSSVMITKREPGQQTQANKKSRVEREVEKNRNIEKQK